MSLNEEFLKLYKQVEMYIDSKYPYADSSVYEHIKNLEKSMVKKDIEKALLEIKELITVSLPPALVKSISSPSSLK